MNLKSKFVDLFLKPSHETYVNNFATGYFMCKVEETGYWRYTFYFLLLKEAHNYWFENVNKFH
jgi:hypothetical protein